MPSRPSRTRVRPNPGDTASPAPPAAAEGPAISSELLSLVDAIARHGSFAKAARELGRVPSAITYSIRRLEDRLDVLLFDRSGHRAILTPAGETLLRDGRLVLQSLEDLSRRVKRVATGWEVELRVAIAGTLPWPAIYDLVADFQAASSATRLRLSSEVLNGTWDALTSGRADLVIGAEAGSAPPGRFETRPLGEMSFAFCVAPQHPLAAVDAALSPADIAAYCAIVVGDTARSLPAVTRGLLDMQQTVVMPTMQAKIDAQVRGLGCGYLPRPLAAPYLAQGLLVEKDTQDVAALAERLVYAWRAPVRGEALKWWLKRLESQRLRDALMGARGPGAALP
jgi:DNA-binding transcriptional LysR family regulator